MSKSMREQDFKKSQTLDKTPIKPPGAPRFRLKGKSEKKNSDRTVTAMSTEEEFCQDLLVEGYVQSFVDFYHLTHRADPNSTDGNQTKIRCTPEDMSFIRNNLVLAELSRRQGNIIGVYTAYNKLAGSYKNKMDWKTAIFFQKKCLEVAQLTTDLKAEMAANHTLGEVYQQMGEFGDARLRHERHEEIAVSIDSAEDIVAANVELHKVYLVLAQGLEQAQQDNEEQDPHSPDEALQMFEKCLGASIKCEDLAAQGEANGKIGNLLLRRGDAAGALPFLEQHSEISTNIGDTEARCRACSSLAWALDSLGEDQRALAELSLVHSISEQAGDAYLQSQACRALGTLYSKVGQLKEAVNVLQRHFDLVKAITSSASREEGSSSPVNIGDLELARVFVGISKGNLMMGSYMHAINFNMNTLLDWKLSRADLSGS